MPLGEGVWGEYLEKLQNVPETGEIKEALERPGTEDKPTSSSKEEERPPEEPAGLIGASPGPLPLGEGVGGSCPTNQVKPIPDIRAYITKVPLMNALELATNYTTSKSLDECLSRRYQQV